jgi:1-acyl-sn-glycerol-3-phosphate acyltransferase
LIPIWREGRVLIIRSVIFNVVFYVNLVIWLIIALPTFVMPYRAIVAVAKAWGRWNLVLLRVICGLKADFRGIEKIPKGPLLVAAKHQSTWETFALLWLFDDPTFILKRELQWIPLFGWFALKGRMIPVDRGAGSSGLNAMTERARKELAHDRQIVIFPEGTRRAAGAEPRYKYGIVQLYAAANVPCLPIALNSGMFWPRRTILKKPGTIVVDILDPIAPGLDKEVFMARLQNDIETATSRLIDEAKRSA